MANPRLLKITFHTFRHWKAAIEYHKTKDILHVMKILGHKNIKNTLRRSPEQSKEARAGFEYVCGVEDAKLFRKSK
jgi:integrase